MAPQSLTERGIAALRAGDQTAARALLAAAVRSDPRDPRAWLWLAGALTDPAQQRQCLERALLLDPGCAPARAGLDALAEGGAAKLTPPSPSTPGGAQSIRVHPEAAPHAQRALRPAAPWHAVWLHPRRAFRAALAGQRAWVPWLLACLAGISALFAYCARRDLGAAMGRVELVAFAALAGAPLGAICLLLGGVLLRTGGRLLGGQAGAGQVRAVLALAATPPGAGLALWMLQLVALPGASFAAAPAGAALALLCGLVHLALWVWAAVLSVVGLAEAHGFGMARAAASWLLGALAAGAGAGAVLAGAALVIWLRGG